MDVKPLQLSFKDNLKKKITYFKSSEAFKHTKIAKEDEDRLADCLKSVEDRIRNESQLDVRSTDCPSEDRKDAQKDDKLRSKKQMELVKKEFVFGFNEIVRKLKEHQIVGVLLASQLSRHIQQTVRELAYSHQVPVLIIDNIEFFQNFFKISRISCFALLVGTQKQESIFHEFNQVFKRINETFQDGVGPSADQNAAIQDVDEDSLDEDRNRIDQSSSSKQSNTETIESNQNEEENLDQQSKQTTVQLDHNKPNRLKSSRSKKLKINHVSIDELWMPRREQTEFHKFASTDRFRNDSDDLLLIRERGDDYFPTRMYI